MADDAVGSQRAALLQACEAGDQKTLEGFFHDHAVSGLMESDREDLNVGIRHAARHGQIATVQYLLDQEYASASQVLTYVLTGAIWGDSIDTFELLLNRGWNINSKEYWDGKVSLRYRPRFKSREYQAYDSE